MSPKLRRLSGAQVIRILESFGFSVITQKGSHAKLRRVLAGKKQTLTIPTHREIDTGPWPPFSAKQVATSRRAN